MLENINPNIYKVEINNQYVTDIVTLLYQRGLFDSLWKLRGKYGLLDELYPHPKSGQAILEFMSTGKHLDLEKDIEALRHEHFIPPHFKRAMADIVVTGKVTNYQRVYYEYKHEYEPADPNEEAPGFHIMMLHPSATKEEVLSAYQTFLDVNNLQTKSAKKIGNSRSRNPLVVESKADTYYHRILSYIDSLPIGRNVASIYEDYRQVRLQGKYIPYVLQKLQTAYPEYSGIGLNDYKEYKSIKRLNVRSGKLDEADAFLRRFDSQYNSVKDAVKEMSEIVSQLQGRFTKKAI